jgi:hypothetical protein
LPGPGELQAWELVRAVDAQPDVDVVGASGEELDQPAWPPRERFLPRFRAIATFN